MQNETIMEREHEIIALVGKAEDLAEKKMKIYARLLMDAALAEDMQTLASRHAQRKTTLESLANGKSKSCEKRKKEAGRCEMNEENAEK